MTKAQMRLILDGVIYELEKATTKSAVAQQVVTLKQVRRELRNREPQTRGRPTSVPITPTVVRMVKKIHATQPDMPQHDIADMVGINQGRVSEILSGVRT